MNQPTNQAMNNMYEQEIEQARKELQQIKSLEGLELFRVKWLGRKDGKITQAMKGIAQLSKSERAVAGLAANRFKGIVETEFELLRKQLARASQQSVVVDPSWPGAKSPAGSIHPVTQMLFKIWEVFSEMNFELCEGPEIETDWNNFEVLNMPKDHPARDMQDTFYVPGGAVLRTHTTATNARMIKGRKPPLRLLSTGKCYRRDSSLRHSPMFHQFDGVMIDRDISMSNLQWTLETALSKILEQEVKTRLRYSYFPFVEPGAELDFSCTICAGEGCAVCKQSGWLELGGCGMLHPNVLRNLGLDSKAFQGFAFGFGIERPLMVKHRIPNIRLFFENDPRFLAQFQAPSI